MTTYFVTTKEGGLYQLSVNGASTDALGQTLDAKGGLVGKQFLPVKTLLGAPAFVNVDTISTIQKQNTGASA